MADAEHFLHVDRELGEIGACVEELALSALDAEERDHRGNADLGLHQRRGDDGVVEPPGRDVWQAALLRLVELLLLRHVREVEADLGDAQGDLHHRVDVGHPQRLDHAQGRVDRVRAHPDAGEEAELGR